MKIKNCDLGKYFSRLIVGDQDKAKLLKKFFKKRKVKKFVFLLEDHPLHIDSVKKKIPAIIIIRIKRKDGRYSSRKSVKVNFAVKNLTEAIKIIRNFQ